MTSTPAESDLTVVDLGPLAWVLQELRKSLEGATKALTHFVKESAQALDSELTALDASQLRLARQQLHQAVGALEMVGLSAPARVLRAVEMVVQKFVQSPRACTKDAVATIEAAGGSLLAYLEDLLAGKPVSAVSLFPQYRDVQSLTGADRIHPADLWVFEWRWLEPKLVPAIQPLKYGIDSRQLLDRLILDLVRTGDSQAAQRLKQLCLGLAETHSTVEPRTFWKVAAGFFEALAEGLLRIDVYTKRAILRILIQYTSLARGETSVSDRLAQDLLFLCTQAVMQAEKEAPVLSAVRDSYGLARFASVDYEASQFGRLAPVQLAQARKRIALAKESWSAMAAGEATQFKVVVDQFGLVADSLVKLYPPSQPLAVALTQAVDATASAGLTPRAELALEVAAALLYLEAALVDLDPSDSQLADRTDRLAERLDISRTGGQAQPLEPWMEELCRQADDRQTTSSVVAELVVALGNMEQSLDHFFRHPENAAVLAEVPGQLAQMRGVLAVLGLDQAVLALTHMQTRVQTLLTAGSGESEADSATTFECLANNLGALGLLIDRLNYQPALAKTLFVFDAENGELRAQRPGAAGP